MIDNYKNNKNIINLLFKFQILCICDINNLIQEKINFNNFFNNLNENQVSSKKQEIINLFNEKNIYSIYQNYYDKISSLILQFCTSENINLFYSTKWKLVLQSGINFYN